MNWKTWIYGLISALIGGAANSVSGAFIAPETFNFNEGLHKMIQLAIAGGIMTAVGYLKKSPLPDDSSTTINVQGNATVANVNPIITKAP